MPSATETPTSAGFDKIKKQRKKKSRLSFQKELKEEYHSNSSFQKELEGEYLSNTEESVKGRWHKENKGKQPDFTLRDDFVVSNEKQNLPSTSNQYKLEKHSLGRSIFAGEVECHRSNKRKIAGSFRHNNLASSKDGIHTIQVDIKVADISLKNNSTSTLQADSDVDSAVQKVESNEETTSSKRRRRRRKRWQNALENNRKEETLEETLLCEQNHIDCISISKSTKLKSQRPLKGMDTDSIVAESKSDVVVNSNSSMEDIHNGSAVEISLGNLVDKPLVYSVKRHCRRNKAVKQIDCEDDKLEDRDDNSLVQERVNNLSNGLQIVSKRDSHVGENMESVTVCGGCQSSVTGDCVIDGSLTLDLVHVSISLNKAPVDHARRKLLVLDLNGLLSDIVSFQPYHPKPDLRISRKSLFKRPFCDDFLKFCFERFNVGVWSSRTDDNTKTVVNFLLGDLKHKLLFCWGQSKCTHTGFNTVEERHKPLFLKELRKLWDKEEPDLPWEKGDYTPANTLLLDDSPYKALRNPPFTAIFPRRYNFKDENDDILGPGGDLRVYLEGIAVTDDIPHYVKEHPFGQCAITDKNPSWSFYRQVIANKNSLLPS